jgi:hypothetical protein
VEEGSSRLTSLRKDRLEIVDAKSWYRELRRAGSSVCDLWELGEQTDGTSENTSTSELPRKARRTRYSLGRVIQ